MNWDDYRYVLAISRTAGLNPAAKLLGVNPSSVYRRLENLEEKLGVRLFERLRSGYRLTEAGELIADAATRMESQALSVERQVVGADLKLEGHVRISASEVMSLNLLPDLLQEFRSLYPGITLEWLASNQLVDMSKREADIVIRGVDRDPEELVGRSVGNVGIASYASKTYLDKRGRDLKLKDHCWVGYSPKLSFLQQAKWIEQNVPDESQWIRFDSFAVVHAAIAAGTGVGTLPCFAGDVDPRLERLPGTHQITRTQVWVLTHPDLRKSARVRACLQFFSERLENLSTQISGNEPGKQKSAAKKAKRSRKVQLQT